MASISLGFAFLLLAAAQIPDPTPAEQTALIKEVRAKTLDYSKALPDFLCTQVMRRYSGKTQAGGEPAWKLLDSLTIHVSYFGQKEDYKVVAMNGKPIDKPLQKMGGIKTMGDFGSVLRDVFRPRSQTQFEWSEWSVWNGRTVAVFRYHIEQAHSEFSSTQVNARLGMIPQTFSLKWAAQGLLYVDPETQRVLRLTVESVGIPANFPVQNVHLALDYANQTVGDREHLLPVKSVSSYVVNGKPLKSESDFSEYRKFAADTTLSFGAEADGGAAKKE